MSTGPKRKAPLEHVPPRVKATSRRPEYRVRRIGLKFVGGKPTLEVALQYHVRTKLGGGRR